LSSLLNLIPLREHSHFLQDNPSRLPAQDCIRQSGFFTAVAFRNGQLR
jgi:hypothetical protein